MPIMRYCSTAELAPLFDENFLIILVAYC